MPFRFCSLAALALCSLTLRLEADDWPQWRGPNRDGISKETGLSKEWPEGGPRLLWQAKDLGEGYSTPAVVGNRLYVISNRGMDVEFVQARDVKTGQAVWSTTIGKVGANNPKAPYPASRSTPTVDGDFLYALGSDGDLACLKAANGETVWHTNVRKDFGGEFGDWAYSESPLVDGDVVVCTPGGKDATLLALDKRKGSVIWKSAVPGADKAAYASIIIVEALGKKQYVQFLGEGLVGVDAKTGQFLWRYEKPGKGSFANIPTPVALGNMIYAGSNMKGAGLIKLKAENGGIGVEPIYFRQSLPTAIGGAILVDGHLYGANGTSLLCIDFATGVEKWQERSIAPASLCYADGRIYLHGEDGTAALMAPSPDAYQEKGRFTPPGGPNRGKSKAWAYPVVANGCLYLRDLEMLWCYDVKATK
jgi:outer membrane protein assembly factor BamB